MRYADIEGLEKKDPFKKGMGLGFVIFAPRYGLLSFLSAPFLKTKDFFVKIASYGQST